MPDVTVGNGSTVELISKEQAFRAMQGFRDLWVWKSNPVDNDPPTNPVGFKIHTSADIRIAPEQHRDQARHGDPWDAGLTVTVVPFDGLWAYGDGAAATVNVTEMRGYAVVDIG